MNVKINDLTLELTEGITLAEALQERNIPLQGIAVAVNGRVVLKPHYHTFKLQDGDSVIIIKAFYGG